MKVKGNLSVVQDLCSKLKTQLEELEATLSSAGQVSTEELEERFQLLEKLKIQLEELAE